MKARQMTFGENEVRTLYAVLTEALERDDVHYWLGSVTIEEAREVARRIKFCDYCERHDKRYEDLTEEDYENYYFEEVEEREKESYDALDDLSIDY